MIRGALRVAADALMVVALAPRCAACQRSLQAPTRGAVCAACWSAITPLRPPLCCRCGDPLASWRVISAAAATCARCRRSPGRIACARAAGEYEGALREIVRAFKYEARRSLAPRLGALMRAAGAELLAGADCAVPVPLHPWRRLRRGFNQSADLAHALGIPVVPALWRSRATASQAGLTAAARRRNVRHAFRISPLLQASRRARFLRDRTVVLVDDVRTTGATLEACAEVLLDAGAREVRALTVARAAPPPTRRS